MSRLETLPNEMLVEAISWLIEQGICCLLHISAPSPTTVPICEDTQEDGILEFISRLRYGGIVPSGSFEFKNENDAVMFRVRFGDKMV